MKKIQIKKFSFLNFFLFFYTFLKNYVRKFFNNNKYSENSRFEVTSLWLRPRIKLSTCETEFTFFLLTGLRKWQIGVITFVGILVVVISTIGLRYFCK